MSGIELLLIAVGLSLDALAVSVAAGLAAREGRARGALKMGLYFGGFQALMPVLGWLAGRTLAGPISRLDHWVAFGLLAAVGLRMIWESFQEDRAVSGRSLDAAAMLSLSLATSIDALAVGLSFALLDVSIVPTALVIGGVTFAVCCAGFLAAGRAARHLGRRVETAGGLILIAIGAKILVEHLRAGLLP